ncbi:MAG: methylated-DNA--[protein]-cysteine S-methyltransferase [Defluviitaleaceae bacterium]|nr:methylated-DNA--[protein]-cysteine S-methyltransferase [Defluviitaleaceae bacterium]
MQYNSPLGRLFIYANGGFITHIVMRSLPLDCGDTNVLLQCKQELNAYFARQLREFTVPIKASGTAFRARCWQELQKIPYGETISYGELAKRISQPTAARAVGGAIHHNPISIIIPCHRVIGASGGLTGYAGGLDMKRGLLDIER